MRAMESKSITKTVRQATKSSGRKPWKWPKGKPRRPKSAYNYFYSQERQKLLRETSSKCEYASDSGSSSSHPQRKRNGLGFSNLTKNIAAKWKLLNDQEKAEFQAQADNDTARYEREKAAWQERTQEDQPQKFDGGRPEVQQFKPSISTDMDIHFKTFDSTLKVMSDLNEQRIELVKEAIEVSQQQVLLLSAQAGMTCIGSTTTPVEGSYHSRALVFNNEITDGAVLCQQHLLSMCHESSASRHPPQEEESLSVVDRSSNESSSMSMLNDIVSSLEGDNCMDKDSCCVDDDTFALFEELDSFF